MNIYNGDKAYEEYGDYVSEIPSSNFKIQNKSQIQSNQINLQQKTRISADSLWAYSSPEYNSGLVASTSLGGSGMVRGSCLSSKFSLSINNPFVNIWSGPDGNCTRGTTLERQVPDYPGPTQDTSYQWKSSPVNQIKEDVLLLAGWVTVKGDIHKEYQNGKKGCDYNIADIYIQKEICIHEVSDKLLNLIANANKTVAEIISNVNQMKDDKFQGRKLGEKIIKPINPADKLINNPEITLFPDLLRNNFIKPIYANDTTYNLQPTTYNRLPDVYYPFRSLFTGRKQEELEFGVKDNGSYFSLTTTIPKDLVGYKLIIPAIDKDEITEYDKNDLSKTSEKFPQIYLDGELIPASSSGSTIDLSYIHDGNLEVRVSKISGYYSSDLQPTTYNLQPNNCDQFNKGIMDRQLIKVSGEDVIRFTSIGSSNCIDFDMPLLTQRIGYLVSVENRNVEGKSFLFSVINKNSQRADIETYLPNSKLKSQNSNPQLKTQNPDSIIMSYFVIPPMEQYGLGYTLHFDNISIGRVKTVNDLGEISVNPIPYRFLTSLKIINPSFNPQLTTYNPQLFSVSHPNPSLYEITLNKELTTNNLQPTTTLILSQSYDKGWNAYTVKSPNLLSEMFPFWFGRKINDHVLVNNWENGWKLTTDNLQPTTIVIVYLPQYLEYIGFILMGAGILIVLFYPKSGSTNIS